MNLESQIEICFHPWMIAPIFRTIWYTKVWMNEYEIRPSFLLFFYYHKSLMAYYHSFSWMRRKVHNETNLETFLYRSEFLSFPVLYPNRFQSKNILIFLLSCNILVCQNIIKIPTMIIAEMNNNWLNPMHNLNYNFDSRFHHSNKSSI